MIRRFHRSMSRLAIILGWFGLLAVTSCQKAEKALAPTNEEQVRHDFTWTGIVFGIDMSMELYSVTSDQRDSIVSEIDKVSLELEQSFSLYLEHSELSVLNRERVLESPSPQFLELLEVATSLNSRTLGYYQPAIHGAWSNLGLRSQSVAQWEAQCAAATLENVLVSPVKVELTNPLTQLSFNAIVQGYLADQVKTVVIASGVKSALLHFGETYTVGYHPEGRSWELAVMGTPVDDEIDFVGTVKFKDAGLAVSAHDGSRLLLNPRNWNLQQTDRVVAIVSEEGAAVADTFATAFAVAPKEDWPALYSELEKGGRCQVKIWVENELVFDEAVK